MEFSSSRVSRRSYGYLIALATVLIAIALPASGTAAKQGYTSASTATLSTVKSPDTSLFSAGSTGDGPATEADCDRYANSMNGLIDLATTLVTQGQDEPGEVEFIVESVESIRDEAEDQGCFVVD